MSRIVKYRKNNEIDEIKFYDIPNIAPNVALNDSLGGHTYAGLISPQGKQIEKILNKYDDYTMALLHFDESVIKDECGNNWTNEGTMAITHNKSKFGNGSLIDTSEGANYMTLPCNINLNTTAVTIDCWFYVTGANTDAANIVLECDQSYLIICLTFYNQMNNSTCIGDWNNNTNSGTWNTGINSKKANLNQWNHYAAVIFNGTASVYLNGENLGNATFSNRTKITKIKIRPKNHVIDEFRFSTCKRWTENFTPPNEPYSKIKITKTMQASSIRVNHNGNIMAIAKSKIAPTFSLSSDSVILYNGCSTQTVTITTDSDGEIDIQSDYPALANITYNDNVISFDYANTPTATATITVKIKESRLYEESEIKTITLKNYKYGALNTHTASEIQSAVRLGIADKLWSVGDNTANISVSSFQLADGYTWDFSTMTAYILGFNHNSSVETNGKSSIHFCLGRKADSSYAPGYDRCILLKEISDETANAAKAGPKHKCSSTSSNAGGWNSSYIKSTWLPNLKSHIDYNWTAVMSSITKYTDNTGKKSTASANVTATSETLFIMSEYEVFGNCSYANTYEADKQAQYQYYKNGAGKTRYLMISTNVENGYPWWLRSPRRTDSERYCRVNSAGASGYKVSQAQNGIVPCFVIC